MLRTYHGRLTLRIRQESESIPDAEPAWIGTDGKLGQYQLQRSRKFGFEATFFWAFDPFIAVLDHLAQTPNRQYVPDPFSVG